MAETTKELTARQIFDRLVKDGITRVQIPKEQPFDYQQAAQLFGHLNVIKSRDKKVFKSLGFEHINAVIHMHCDMTAHQIVFTLVNRRERKKFTVVE